MAGRDRSTISLIESNHNFPHPATIQRIAGALDVPPEALTDPSWEATVPKEPPPRSMDELLERAGVANRTFTMSLVEIGEAFKGLSYQEAYKLAREIADARAAVKPVLALYAGSTEEVALTVQSMERNMVANLSFQAIAERERGQAVAEGNLDRAELIERELKEVA
jgi:transcriptional regulator with XRE-family HTH domain